MYDELDDMINRFLSKYKGDKHLLRELLNLFNKITTSRCYHEKKSDIFKLYYVKARIKRAYQDIR